MEEMRLLDTSAKSSLLNLAEVFLYLRARWERQSKDIFLFSSEL